MAMDCCPYNTGLAKMLKCIHTIYMHVYSCTCISQRGDSPFVYRDGTGLPALLPYIRKIHVSVAISTQSGIRLHERVPMVKI